MNRNKFSGVILTVSVSIVLFTSLAISKNRYTTKSRLAPSSPYRQTADGGAPVPPLPPRKNWSRTNLTADGGAPVPPLPPAKPNPNLVADGGEPVPPLPPPKPRTQFLLA